MDYEAAELRCPTWQQKSIAVSPLGDEVFLFSAVAQPLSTDHCLKRSPNR